MIKPDDVEGADKTVREDAPPAANDQPVYTRLETASPPGPGAVLRTERETRGFSIDDVANALKLAPRQVEAIEADDFDALRGQTFARGFVKNYARLLQLDPEPLVARIRSAAAETQLSIEPRANTQMEVPLSSGGQGPVVAGGLAVLALVVVAVVGTAGDWLSPDPAARRAAADAKRLGLSETATSVSTPPSVSPLASSVPTPTAADAASGSITETLPGRAEAGEVAASASAGMDSTNTAPSAGSVPVTSVQNTSDLRVSSAKASPALSPATAATAPVSAPPASPKPSGPTASTAATPTAAASVAARPVPAGPAVTPTTSYVLGPGASPDSAVVATAAVVKTGSGTTASAAVVKPASAIASSATAMPAARAASAIAPASTPPAVKYTSGSAMSFTTPPKAASSSAAPDASVSFRAGDLAMTATVGKARSERRLTLNFEEEAWVEVKDGEGRIVFSQLSPAGSTRVVNGKGKLNLVVGNAHHVKLKVDDKPFDIKPHIGVTVARFSLD